MAAAAASNSVEKLGGGKGGGGEEKRKKKKRKLSEVMPELYLEIDQKATQQMQPANHPGLLFSELGVWSQQEVVWRCSVDQSHTWITRIGYRAQGGKARPCPKCREQASSQRKVAVLEIKGCEKSRIELIKKELALQVDRDNFDQLRLYSCSKLKWKCLHCAHEWDARLESRLLRNNNCPKCFDRTSANEKRCRQALNDLSMPFFANHRIGCGTLTVDMYIPPNSLTEKCSAVAIEIDGEYHFKDPVVMARDQIKNRYCRDNRIHLLRIHHRVPQDYRILLCDFFESIQNLTDPSAETLHHFIDQ